MLLTDFIDAGSLQLSVSNFIRSRFLSNASAYTNPYIQGEVLNAADYIVVEITTEGTSLSVRFDNTYSSDSEDVRQEVESIMQEVSRMEDTLLSNEISYMLEQQADQIGETYAKEVIEPMFSGTGG